MNPTIAKVRRIGNSKGILFTKTILEKSEIKKTVQIIVKNKVIMISAADESRRKQWTDFKKAAKEKIDLVQNKFDKTDWTW